MSTGERPLLIGVSARIYMPGTAGINVSGIWTKNLHYLEQSVAHWVLSGHAMAVMIPAVTKDSIVTRSDLDLDDYAHTLDGLVLQGGNDVAPETYGETPLHPDWAGDRVRDRYEIELIDAFVRAGKPVFGICRGLQLLNVALGGTLLPGHRHAAAGTSRAHRDGSTYERHFHDVELVPGIRAGAAVPRRAAGHGQQRPPPGDQGPGARLRRRGLLPDDGMIEAIRRTRPVYVAAVQWHPEFHVPGDPDDSTTRRCCTTSSGRARAPEHA